MTTDTAAPGEPVGALQTALAHTVRLLGRNPALAELQAREILAAVPGHPEALLLLARARGAQSDAEGALAILEPLAKAQPRAAVAHMDLGAVLGLLGRSESAIAALERAVALKPDLADAWRLLADQKRLLGDDRGAEAATDRQLQASVSDPELLRAAGALLEGRLAVAERLLRDFLKRHPADVAALRMLAEIGARLGRYEDAEVLLARALELAPEFDAARFNYATVLYREGKPEPALAELDTLMAKRPQDPNYRTLKAAALNHLGEHRQSIGIYEALLAEYPRQPKGWMSYGHALKTLGRQDDAIAAYRRSIEQAPNLGEAYWSLANLKTVRLGPADVAAMRAQLDRSDISDDDRFHLHFALGKALEDAGEFEPSFEHYRLGNALRRKRLDYDADETSRQVQRAKALFTADFFAERAGQGSPAPDPIFIVGLPRAGSTLIEQILASHSAVEGTMELPDVMAIARRVGGGRIRGEEATYPAQLATLSPEELAALGEEFLQRTRVHRKLGRPFFIDKMPNNFQHTGLIHLMLPRAKIIDARRHPMGGCFSGFKQHFARGQGFTYDLTDVGRYYADYVELMAHFDAVLPGRVHRVIYEAMVADPEAEVRRLLDYCGLPFEAGCLRFYENDRAVRTASSEQVRRPIFTEGVDQWRNYEPWLDPLKAALGPVLDAYPHAPVFPV
ncbi:sulfotransferase [Caulobacter sp. KR2-114]|uniref:tetratricopeptide repeat-containing sulfotransferase family protein n=1 Tax=Caulobacter sp. KR2-114 TaxID=3400912 RepID=UPI003C0E9BE9